MDDYPVEQAIRQRYKLLQPVLDERLRRLWAAAEAMALGTGGIATVSKATGLSRATVRAGIKQLEEPNGEWMGLTSMGRARKPGAGRKSAIERESGIENDLERLMESRETEQSGPLVWTCKSLRRLAEELGTAGHPVSYRTVGNLLHRLGYSFGQRGDYKKCSLASRRESFRGIAGTAAEFLGRGEPVLSVWLQAPREAVATSYLMVAGLLSWWRQDGLQRYSRARRMLLTTESAVAGDAWTEPLEVFAAEVRLEVAVAHFPPGTWRWQKSTRQVTCSCSRLPRQEGMAEIGVVFDLVLPSTGS